MPTRLTDLSASRISAAINWETGEQAEASLGDVLVDGTPSEYARFDSIAQGGRMAAYEGRAALPKHRLRPQIQAGLSNTAGARLTAKLGTTAGLAMVSPGSSAACFPSAALRG